MDIRIMTKRAINCIYDIKKWNEINMGNLQGANNICKLLFFLTNIIFFIPIMLYKITTPIFLLTIMGIISSIFHGHQIWFDKGHRHCTMCLMWIDTFFVFPAGAIILLACYTKLPLWWYLFWILPILCWRYGTVSCGQNLYMLLHGSWHVMAGLLFWYALKPQIFI